MKEYHEWIKSVLERINVPISFPTYLQYINGDRTIKRIKPFKSVF